MTDTPRTDRQCELIPQEGYRSVADLCRQLERELAEARKDTEVLAARLTFKRGRHQGNPSTLVQFWIDDGDPISFGAAIDAARRLKGK